MNQVDFDRPHGLRPDVHLTPMPHQKDYPEPLFSDERNLVFGLSGKQYWRDGDVLKFTNPMRVTLGQVAAGDVLQVALPFGLVRGQPFSHNIMVFRVNRIVGTPTQSTKLCVGVPTMRLTLNTMML